jgi:hypothetical protein
MVARGGGRSPFCGGGDRVATWRPGTSTTPACSAAANPPLGSPVRSAGRPGHDGGVPYASAARVFWVVDNGSSHRGQAAVKRLEGRYNNLRLIHLPVHASWLNQIEIYFSIEQRKVLTPNDFTDLVEVQQRLLGFQHRYQQTAAPFDWRYTRSDLNQLLRRLDDQEQLTKAA